MSISPEINPWLLFQLAIFRGIMRLLFFLLRCVVAGTGKENINTGVLRGLVRARISWITNPELGEFAVSTVSLKVYARAVVAALIAAAALFFVPASAQQSIIENIRPVGQVCLAGASCAGARTAPANTTTTAPAPSAAPPAVEETAAFDVAAVYQQSCFACHGSGAAGAPLLGDAEGWALRLEKGRDVMIENTLNGLNSMPARGLCVDCSDDDLTALVDYMTSQ
jgi:cytochrome c5